MKIRTSGVSIGVLQVMAVLALALTGLLLGLGAGHAQTGAPPSSLAPRLGFVAPNTQLETLAGDRFDLAHWRGKVVVLDFWATWCGPCLGALPALKQLNIDYAGKPFALVSISGDRDGSNLHEFVANHGMSWTQCWDGNGDAQRRFRVRGLPTYFVLDAAGRIVYGATGWSRGAERPLRNAIEKAFAASPPAAAGPAAGTTTLR